MKTALLTNLEKYMTDPNSLTEREGVILYEEIYQLCFHLANKHFKKVQRLIDPHILDEKQRHRVDIFYEYAYENVGKRSAEYILFTFNRRFSWIEFIVECRYLGISLFDLGVPISKQIGAGKVRILINAMRLYRLFIQRKGYEPSVRELTIELIKWKLLQGKIIRFSSIHQHVGEALKFIHCKRYTDSLREEDYD